MTSQELGQRIFGDREAVVLRGDFDGAGLQILHRMIRAAMAELELERLRAAGQAEQLVAEADAEDRLLAEQAADRADRVVERLGVAGAVREEDAVGLVREHFFGGGGAGQDRHAAAQVDQVARDVPLHAVVEGDDVGLRVEGRALSPKLRSLVREWPSRCVHSLSGSCHSHGWSGRTSRTRSRPTRPGLAFALATRLASSRSVVERTPFIAPPMRSRRTRARVSIDSIADDAHCSTGIR